METVFIRLILRSVVPYLFLAQVFAPSTHAASYYVKYQENNAILFMKAPVGGYYRYCSPSEVPSNVVWTFHPYKHNGGVAYPMEGGYYGKRLNVHWTGVDSASSQNQSNQEKLRQEETARRAEAKRRADETERKAAEAKRIAEEKAAAEEKRISDEIAESWRQHNEQMKKEELAHEANLQRIRDEADASIQSKHQEREAELKAENNRRLQSDRQAFENFKQRELTESAARAGETKSNLDKILCFPGDTLVIVKGKAPTELQAVPISMIHVGDSVLSCNHSMGSACEFGRVREVFRSSVSGLVKLSFGGRTLRTTENHPIYLVDQNSYREAGSLKIGDLFQSFTGETFALDGKEIETGEFEVYNLDVESNHNFYACDILVHNCDAKSAIAERLAAGGGIFAVGSVAAVAAATGTAITIPGLGEVILGAGATALLVQQFGQMGLNQAYSESGQGNGDSAGQAEAPSRPNQMQKEVERGQAPRDVERVDKPHVPGQEPHVHYKDGTSSNQSGGVHDAHKGQPNPSKATKEWLKDHGWIPPKK